MTNGDYYIQTFEQQFTHVLLCYYNDSAFGLSAIQTQNVQVINSNHLAQSLKLNSTSLVSLQHCYTSDWDECSEWLTRYPGLMVGFTPFICNSRFERPIHEVVRKIPLDRILFETDSPYFLPPKSKIAKDGSFIEDLPPSHPGHVIHTAAQVSLK